MPPLTVTLALPSACPQLAAVAAGVSNNTPGWVIAIVLVVVQPLASVTVTV